jgi:hypothetical protein
MYTNCDISISTVIVFRFPVVAENLFLLSNVQKGSDEYRTFRYLAINMRSFTVCNRGLAVKLANHLQLVMKLDWSCTSTPSYAFMACSGTALLYQVLIDM